MMPSAERLFRCGKQDHLDFLPLGSAVVDDPSLPVVGDANRIDDTYLEQLVAGARAAVDKAVSRGVVDRDRIGVMGHSHGALMTVNLLTHTDLFRAGIARSGAYDRSLTAFGFQNERRTLWEATDVYVKVSPCFHVNDLKRPVLLVHGQARRVPLPYESHGYSALESNGDVVAARGRVHDSGAVPAGTCTLEITDGRTASIGTVVVSDSADASAEIADR